MRAVAQLVALLSACLLTTADGAAPAYPAHPVQLVVPYGPGGAVDVIGRFFAEHLSQSLGQPVLVLNKPGANANIGPAFVAHANADGYTLLASSTATVVNPLLEKDLNWRPQQFIPVARYVQAPNVLVVPPSLDVNTLAEFVALAKARPGLTTSMAGPGTPQTISTGLLAQAAGISLTDVAYKGGVSYLPDLISGRLSVSIAPMNVVLQHVRNGKLVPLAVTGEGRSSMLPEVPTLAEAGYPEATGVSWYGLHAPAGTPQNAIERLTEAVRAATEDSRVRERVAAVGAETAFLGTKAFEVFLADETAKAQRYVQAAKSQ
ncbi:MAG TPA: tripartite tricarboxylate transporter substrate binding protein [Burkholderiaceae bacterium]|nr:tripartite tricarboxylate transporter substrate binding protein [Burkholderiaceae bacterium]